MILDNRLGNTPRWYLTPPKDYRMRVPDEIRQCVGYLCLKVGMGKGVKYYERGTAFVVGVPYTSGKGVHHYLATAAHNIDDLNEQQATALERNQNCEPRPAGRS